MHPRHPRLGVLLVVGIGGSLGTLARHELSTAIPAGSDDFPLAIFAVNVAGAFVLGALMTLVLERLPPSRYVRPLIGIGFCGGLTTFSSWMVDDVLLVDTGRTGTAIAYVAASLVAGLSALYAGIVVVRASTRPRRIRGETP